mgnify:CR=1 FL=1
MTSVGVNEAGQIVASYSNGDTKKIGQIAVASLLTHQVLKKLVIIFMQQHLTLVHLMELVKIYQSQAARLHLDILKCQM